MTLKKRRFLLILCSCPEWAVFLKEHIRLDNLGITHSVGYRGPKFKICPFCGKKLKEVTP